MEQLLGWLCFSNQERGAEDFGVGHGKGMAQLIEGNFKVTTNCGVDIKVKGKKIKKERQSKMMQGKNGDQERPNKKGKMGLYQWAEKTLPMTFSWVQSTVKTSHHWTQILNRIRTHA